MGGQATEHFVDIIRQAKLVFQQVEYEVDVTPERAILRLQANYGQYRIFATELYSDRCRKYSYYILRGEWVEAGFDNSPDPRAIRQKYGEIGKEHIRELLPHLHLKNKTRLILTSEMTFDEFIAWIEKNVNE